MLSNFKCIKCDYLFTNPSSRTTFENGEAYVPPCPKCASAMKVEEVLC